MGLACHRLPSSRQWPSGRQQIRTVHPQQCAAECHHAAGVRRRAGSVGLIVAAAIAERTTLIRQQAHREGIEQNDRRYRAIVETAHDGISGPDRRDCLLNSTGIPLGRFPDATFDAMTPEPCSSTSGHTQMRPPRRSRQVSIALRDPLAPRRTNATTSRRSSSRSRTRLSLPVRHRRRRRRWQGDVAMCSALHPPISEPPYRSEMAQRLRDQSCVLFARAAR